LFGTLTALPQARVISWGFGCVSACVALAYNGWQLHARFNGANVLLALVALRGLRININN